MANDEIQGEQEAPLSVIAIIDCREVGVVRILDSADVAESEDALVVPSPKGEIIVVGKVTDLNEPEIIRAIDKLSLGDI